MFLDQINQEANVEDEAVKTSFPFAVAVEYGRGSNQGLRVAFQDTTIPYPQTSGARLVAAVYSFLLLLSW